MTWQRIPDIEGYAVHRGTGQNGDYWLLKTVTANSYTDLGLEAGRTYYFKIKAYKVNGNGERVYSDWSSIESVIVK